MTGLGCPKTKSGKRKKHTPIVSEKQRRLFYAKASGKKTKATSLTRKEAKKHLKEVKGKKLPEESLESKTKKRLKKVFK